jgi:hypothetical protein
MSGAGDRRHLEIRQHPFPNLASLVATPDPRSQLDHAGRQKTFGK